MVLGYCIVHNVLLFLRSRECAGTVQCWYGSSLDGGGSGLAFLHSSVCWKWGRFYEWSRMISNALVVIHIYALGQTRIYARIIYNIYEDRQEKPCHGSSDL